MVMIECMVTTAMIKNPEGSSGSNRKSLILKKLDGNTCSIISVELVAIVVGGLCCVLNKKKYYCDPIQVG